MKQYKMCRILDDLHRQAISETKLVNEKKWKWVIAGKNGGRTCAYFTELEAERFLPKDRKKDLTTEITVSYDPIK